MHRDEIKHYILANFDDIHPINSWGEESFFHNPGHRLTRGTYFATLKAKDGDNDKASNLDRDGIFRLNMGVTKACYLSLFSHLPKRPAKGCFIEGNYDFQQLDTLLPHPVYGWGAWICVLNPSRSTFQECTNYLEIAYNKAKQATEKKLSKQ